jgi:hypothetical protein
VTPKWKALLDLKALLGAAAAASMAAGETEL